MGNSHGKSKPLVDISNLRLEYSVTLQPAASHMKASCPFHVLPRLSVLVAELINLKIVTQGENCYSDKFESIKAGMIIEKVFFFFFTSKSQAV